MLLAECFYSGKDNLTRKGEKMEQRTKEDITREYLHNNGLKCPFCGKGPLSSGSPDPDIMEGKITQEIKCLQCGEEWLDVYTLTGIDLIE